MLAKIHSCTLLGLSGVHIDVEVDVAYGGFPSFTIVGLPGKAVDESKDRVRTAIINTSLDMPESRITVNLAPADLPKSGSSFDLPIAIGILAAAKVVPEHSVAQAYFVGELSLEGHVRPIAGAISLTMLARQEGARFIYIPAGNVKEASLVEGIEIIPVSTLEQLVLHLQAVQIIEPYERVDRLAVDDERDESESDFSHIQGQHQAKRALEVAAAGFHNVHMKGPPGAGKTMLSRAFVTILPPLERAELLEVIQVYSAAGQTVLGATIRNSRPFRSPHHTSSRVGLIGGGSVPRPGEISLAHRGVLFLDEFPEFPRSVLESLRQPLEDGVVTVSRAAGSVDYPARFLLVAASNPCPCGYLGHPKKPCTCMPAVVARYKKRLSGPILDRIDLHVDVSAVDEGELLSSSAHSSEKSEDIRARIQIARSRQMERFADHNIHANSQMSSAQVRALCVLDPEATVMLKQAITHMSLSARATFKVIKVAQTIADLEQCPTISTKHIAESLQYRVKD